MKTVVLTDSYSGSINNGVTLLFTNMNVIFSQYPIVIKKVNTGFVFDTIPSTVNSITVNVDTKFSAPFAACNNMPTQSMSARSNFFITNDKTNNDLNHFCSAGEEFDVEPTVMLNVNASAPSSVSGVYYVQVQYEEIIN